MKIICFLLIFTYIFSLLVLSVGADVTDEFPSKLDAALGDGTALPDMENIETAGEDLIEFLSPEKIFSEVLGIGENALKGAVSTFFLLLGVLLLSAALNSMAASVSGGALAAGTGYLCSAVCVAAVVGTQIRSLEEVADFFERLGALMASMIPIGGTVWAMGGNVSTASVGTATLYAMVALTERLCASAVLPVCCVCGAAAVCAGLSDGGVLDGFCGAVKKIYNFFLGLIMSIFVFVLGAQTTVSTAADTAAARSGKFISSVVIPGVGGALGDTVRTLAGSVGYIKSVVGVGGIVLVAWLTFPVLFSLLAMRLVFLVSATVAQMLGCKCEQRLLCELGNIYGLLVGAVSICAVAFVIAMAIFLKCAVAIE